MKYCFFFAILFLGVNANAQTTKVTLKGTLTMATGEEFPYRLELTENNNIITGFSYTYDEKDEAKTIIKGRVDKAAHKLTFKETEIVSSHSVTTQAFMCMLQASLEYRNNKLAGPATNKQLDNTACTAGKLTFSNTADIEQLFSSHDPYDVEIKMGEKKKEVEAPASPAPAAVAAVAADPAPDKITVGVDKSYEWHDENIVVEVWDGGVLDGDMVTILFDGKPVLEKYQLQKQKRKIIIPLPISGVHRLAIQAVNEGTDPPNTASITLSDGYKTYSILAYNKKGDYSIIKINRWVGK